MTFIWLSILNCFCYTVVKYMYTYRKFFPPAEYLVFIINAMYKSSVFLTIYIFMSVHSCLDLQRPILRHKLAVTDLTMWQRGKRAKIKSKSAVSENAVLGFVVLYNWLGKQLLLTHQRANHTRVKNVWKRSKDLFLYPDLTWQGIEKECSSNRLMTHQLMLFYMINTSVYWLIVWSWSWN